MCHSFSTFYVIGAILFGYCPLNRGKVTECSKCGFGDFDLEGSIRQAEARGLKIIGSIRLNASYFLAGHWEIKHDPFPFMRKGSPENQHPNHVQIICDKEIEVYDKLKPLKWFYKNGTGFVQEYENQIEPLTPTRRINISLTTTLILAAIILAICLILQLNF